MEQTHTEAHPQEKLYVKVALWLALVTGVEIAISYIEMPIWVAVLALVVLAVIKFTAVVAYFMHLKFDEPMLRKPFVGGLILALAVYTIVLLAFTLHD